MSISEAKLDANRLNGAKSHGPVSATGRARSAQNAIKHGLCSVFNVLESEDQGMYNDLLQRFVHTEKPADDVEYELVARMARATWMSERAVRFQSGCFIHQPRTEEQVADDSQTVSLKLNELEKFMRYQTTHERAYDRAANALAKHRKEKAAQERGFVSQQRAEAAETRKEAAEARRQKQEKQREEAHELRQRRQKIKLELDQIRFLKQFPPDMHGQVLQTLQAAA
jgi:hypothetical protein